ncbi:MAG TPA: P1 family peptidase [Acidimicrobiia bacterium]|nr:P1 family peptidase [Acidimicrobiia bacterium]
MTRLRDLGVAIGRLPTGPNNAITDVPGVGVGQVTLIREEPSVVRTGVTMVVPRDNEIWDDYAFCGWHSFNGNGEMTGLPWIDESGMLGSPIAITNTHQVGMVRDSLVRYAVERRNETGFILPVAAETYDGWLSDAGSFPLTESDAFKAVDMAAGGTVAEGNVGGGTGMICHEFKGGTGTSSRVVDLAMHSYTVGVLVQANYGSRGDFRIDGIPVGRHIGYDQVPAPWPAHERDGSIIVVIATDAPLLATQCSRLARRATVGLARVGGVGHNGSGDLFVAFATGNRLSEREQSLRDLKMLPDEALDRFFVAVADATEEAIVNALCAAETMTGYRGRTAHALPVEEVAQILSRYRNL